MVPQVRKISSVPHAGATTLQAITDDTQSLTARVQAIEVKSEKTQTALRNVPDDVGSRLDWLSGQLGNL